jgi:hypothetical protein
MMWPRGKDDTSGCPQLDRRLSPAAAILTLALQGSGARPQGDNYMLGIIAAVLIILWLLGFFAFHVTAAFIHIVLVVGLVLLVLHFMRGSA